MTVKKIRLDVLVQKQLSNLSRTQVSNLILEGKVSVLGKVVKKPGAQFLPDVELKIDFTELKYVSRAGFKLEHILQESKIDVQDLVALDAGLSTGGFTDCLLQNGVKKVYGVDVGTNQVHDKISNDKRVVVMEQTNLRYLDSLPEQVDLITLDLSFISILKILDNAKKFLKPGGKLITLIKPQFEAGKELVSAGSGIIKDDAVHQQVIKNVCNGIEKMGFKLQKILPSPILGGDGNKEFLAYFSKNLD